MVLARLPTHPIQQMFFLGFLPTPLDLQAYKLTFLFAEGSFAFFLTLVRLCYAFSLSASLLLRCSPTLGRGKPVDDLSATQFNALAKVHNLLSSKRDFKYLLTPSNLQEVVIKPKDFIIPSVPHLHFEGPRNACAMEHVLNLLLARIMTAIKAQEYEQA